MSHTSRPDVPGPRARRPAPDTAPRSAPPGDDLVVAPSQPRAGLLVIRVAGDLVEPGAARCARVLHGAVDAAAAEHEARGADARVVCDLTDVGRVASGLDLLADVDAYARSRGVDFVVVDERRASRWTDEVGLDRRPQLVGDPTASRTT